MKKVSQEVILPLFRSRDVFFEPLIRRKKIRELTKHVGEQDAVEITRRQNVFKSSVMQCCRLIVDIADPMRLLKDMQTEGLTLKQNVLGRVFDPSDPNQVGILSPRHQRNPHEEIYILVLIERLTLKRILSLYIYNESSSDNNILTNFHKKGCWVLNKAHLSSDANKPY